MAKTSKTATTYLQQFLESDRAYALYCHLAENIPWIDGIPTRTGGFTRKAYPVGPDEQPLVHQVIAEVMDTLDIEESKIFGIYLNFYRDGSEYAPVHSHKGMRQVIISLGTDRVLTVGKKEYLLSNGDVIIFGAASHGIVRDKTITEGRISIAVFTDK